VQPVDDFVGTICKGYKILKRLGEGTYGRVYHVEELKTQERYSMKIQRVMDEEWQQGQANEDAVKELEFLMENKFPFII
jgi:serine/threonine protein kinase